jgi:putative endonuclease
MNPECNRRAIQNGGELDKWYVYIAETRTKRYYVGISNDVAARIVKHNTGKGSRFAIEQGPFVLVYTSEPFDTKNLARKREIQLKGWSHEKKYKLIKGVWR